MIKIILISGLFFVCLSYAQNVDSLICAERGHVFSGISSSTLMYFSPQLVDLPDKTIKIYWNHNIITKVCERCGAVVKEPAQEKPDTVIVWRKQ